MSVKIIWCLVKDWQATSKDATSLYRLIGNVVNITENGFVLDDGTGLLSVQANHCFSSGDLCHILVSNHASKTQLIAATLIHDSLIYLSMLSYLLKVRNKASFSNVEMSAFSVTKSQTDEEMLTNSLLELIHKTGGLSVSDAVLLFCEDEFSMELEERIQQLLQGLMLDGFIYEENEIYKPL